MEESQGSIQDLLSQIAYNYLWSDVTDWSRDDLLQYLTLSSHGVVGETPQDASCLFQALLHQAQRHGTHTETTAQGLRLLLVNHLRERQGVIQTYKGDGSVALNLQEVFGEGLEEYFERMQDPAQYGDHFILQAAADYFKQNIWIIKCPNNSDNSIFKICGGPTAESRPIIMLGHYDKGHYESLSKIGDGPLGTGMNSGHSPDDIYIVTEVPGPPVPQDNVPNPGKFEKTNTGDSQENSGFEDFSPPSPSLLKDSPKCRNSHHRNNWEYIGGDEPLGTGIISGHSPDDIFIVTEVPGPPVPQENVPNPGKFEKTNTGDSQENSENEPLGSDMSRGCSSADVFIGSEESIPTVPLKNVPNPGVFKETNIDESHENSDDLPVVIGLTMDVRNQVHIAAEFSNSSRALYYFWPDNFLPHIDEDAFDFSLLCRDLVKSLLETRHDDFIQLLHHTSPQDGGDVDKKDLILETNLFIKEITDSYGPNMVKVVPTEDSQYLLIYLNKAIDQHGLLRRKIREAQEESEASQQMLGDSRPDPEDMFALDEATENLRIEKPFPESFYKGCQSKLGDVLLHRAQQILCPGKPLSEAFDECSIQIYTTNINMLENQTRQRIQDPDSEFFSPEVYKDPRHLKKASYDSVKKYNLRSDDVIVQTKRLHEEALQKPKKLFLIIADEAHWGIRGQNTKKPKVPAEQQEEEGSRELERTSGAYDYLVNRWSEHKNALIVQVTATPYNLLTENTRLDLERMVPEVNPNTSTVAASTAGPSSVRSLTQSRTKYGKRLQHVKWTEGLDYYLQKGLTMVIYVMFTNQNSLLYFEANAKEELHQWKPLEADDGGMPEFLFEGTIESVTIKSTDKQYYLAATSTGDKVGFLEARKVHGNVNFITEFCLDVSYGEDAFLILTKDHEHQLYMEDGHGIALKKLRSRARGIYKDPFSDPPQRNELFMVQRKKTADEIDYGKQYISLNTLVASSGEEEQEKRYLRSDDNFKDMKRKVKSTVDDAKKHCFILGAEYSYYILLIYELRKAKLQADSFLNMVSHLSDALGDYTAVTESLVEEFVEKLTSPSRSGELIPKDVFLSSLEVIGDILTENAGSEFKAYMDAKLAQTDMDNIQEACVILCYLLDCCFFARKAKLEKLSQAMEGMMSQAMKRMLDHKKQKKLFFLSEAFKNLKKDFKDLYKPRRMQENETCRVVHDLALKRNTNVLKGKMKILRIKGGYKKKELANKIFSSLCLARRVSSPESYSFEILRDYDTFKISDLEKSPKEKQEKTAVFRIRRLFQQRKCEETHPETYEQCQCSMSEPRKEDLKCTICGHLHKKIESYEDLDKLPVLLIVVNKGRMGDTFPPSFNFLDMRLTPDINYLSTFVQELGRLCRYANVEDESSKPYALLTKEVEDMIMNARQRHGTYHAISKFCKGKDQYVQNRTNLATKDSMDYKNKKREHNRMLFEAETQIGKTGAYINFASKVRKAVQGVIEEVETDEELSASEDEEDESEGEDMERQVQRVAVLPNDKKTKWMRPYWRDIDRAKSLPQEIVNGKYRKLYGPYRFGKDPQQCTIRIPPGMKKSHKTSGIHIKTPEGYRTHRKSHWEKCQECKESGTPWYQQYERDYFRGYIKVSVPQIKRMKNVLKTLKLGSLVGDTSEEEPTLRTWIFTPSYRRHHQAYLNLKHTMLDRTGRPASFVQIIVVQMADFEAYVQTWGGSHAIVTLPESMPLTGTATPETGGVGYARSFIQQFAQEYKLDAIFMLDDNIMTSREVQFTRIGGEEVVTRPDSKCYRHESVPLFCILQDLERQISDKNNAAPVVTFEGYPSTNCQAGTQEAYTGPWSCYGLVGVLKNRGTTVNVKQPFIKTHVHSLVLLNIKALEEKGILYKPWSVWEDLNFNNQADEKGLWVVKYSRWNISKANIHDWFSEVYYWDENTVLTKSTLPMDDQTSQCTNIIQRYINRYFPVRHVISSSPHQDEITDTSITLVAEGIKPHPSSSFLLIIFTKEDITEDNIPVIREHLSNSRNLLCLLPACLCQENGLRTRRDITDCFSSGMWASLLPPGVEFEVITSGNVTDISVSLILLIIITPGEPKVEKSEIPTTIEPWKSETLNRNPSREEDQRSPSANEVSVTDEPQVNVQREIKTNGNIDGKMAQNSHSKWQLDIQGKGQHPQDRGKEVAFHAGKEGGVYNHESIAGTEASSSSSRNNHLAGIPGTVYEHAGIHVSNQGNHVKPEINGGGNSQVHLPKAKVKGAILKKRTGVSKNMVCAGPEIEPGPSRVEAGQSMVVLPGIETSCSTRPSSGIPGREHDGAGVQESNQDLHVNRGINGGGHSQDHLPKAKVKGAIVKKSKGPSKNVVCAGSEIEPGPRVEAEQIMVVFPGIEESNSTRSSREIPGREHDGAGVQESNQDLHVRTEINVDGHSQDRVPKAKMKGVNVKNKTGVSKNAVCAGPDIELGPLSVGVRQSMVVLPGIEASNITRPSREVDGVGDHESNQHPQMKTEISVCGNSQVGLQNAPAKGRKGTKRKAAGAGPETDPQPSIEEARQSIAILQRFLRARDMPSARELFDPLEKVGKFIDQEEIFENNIIVI